MLPAKDISRYQGAFQDTGEPIVMIKIGGGDDGLYYDSQASQNWSGAVNAGKAVGGYWFAGGGNPSAEAAFFLRGMLPLTENDVYALDVESSAVWNPNAPGVDPVAWVSAFVNYVHDHIGVWPLIYMNLNTLQLHNWHPVLNNCGLWLADWNVSPTGTIPTSYLYVMQQFSDGPVYDHDEWFGTLDQFKAYGWHAPAPLPPPAPAPAPPPPVVTTTTSSTSTSGTVITVTPPMSTRPSPTLPVPLTPAQSWVKRFVSWLLAIFGIKLS